MNAIVYHVASGHVFFTGVLLVMVATAASMQSSWLAKRVVGLAFALALVAIAISSTPLPFWIIAITIVVTPAWLFALWIGKWQRPAAISVMLVWASAAANEGRYHITPQLEPASSQAMAVIGDSLTAGMGGGDHSEKWPSILAREHGLGIQDLSHAGATTASALECLRQQRITAPVVLLEIGGNDLLGSTNPQQFHADLDALLSRVTRGDRQVLMLELPLPPFRQAFGHVQRRLADKYDVALVPKRVFLSVLVAADATVDTIHLSASGHRRMAEVVWQLVESAFSDREPRGG